MHSRTNKKDHSASTLTSEQSTPTHRPIAEKQLDNPRLCESQEASKTNIQDQLDILVLSNGHGEDLVARRITAAILKSNKNITVGALPLVGIGSTYERLLLKTARLIILNPRQIMPSAGFCAKNMRWLWADIRSGLIQLLVAQFRAIRQLARRNHCLTIAVGDSLPLALAWLSGGSYVYVQLKKSDHMWMHHKKRLSYWWYSLVGTNWNPLEIALAKSKRCVLRFTRDVESSRNLARIGIIAYPANPMMDKMNVRLRNPSKDLGRNIICLPGSRNREMISNFQSILNIIKLLIRDADRPLTFLVPMATEDMQKRVNHMLLSASLKNTVLQSQYIGNISNDHRQHQIICGKGMLRPWSEIASVGIAMAGTATEQVAGVGIPCVTIAGEGPQFCLGFAKRQHRLLGKCAQLAKNYQHAAKLVLELLNDDKIAMDYGQIGVKRMNSLGGSQQVATKVLSILRSKMLQDELQSMGSTEMEISQEALA
jgi:uncharacterized protein (TIGR03492 family)